MTKWPYRIIREHTDRIVERLTSQYEAAEKMKGWVGVWGERAQLVENAARGLLEDRWLWSAEGVQLDKIGGVVGEQRFGREDPEFKSAIHFRIMANRGGGEPEQIIRYLKDVGFVDRVLLLEIYPAHIEIYVRGELQEHIVRGLRNLIPAGIGRLFLTETGPFLPFGYNEIAGYDWLFELSNGDLLELSGEELLEIRDGRASPPWPSEDFLHQGGYGERDGFSELGMHSFELHDGFLLELSGGDLFALTDKEDPVFVDEGGKYAELFEV